MSSRILVRELVRSRISSALRFPVTILQAPAGFGKSIALTSALDALDVRAVRYAPNSQTDSLASFVRGLADALEPFAPAARLSFAAAWERAVDSRGPEEQLARWLHAHLEGHEVTIVLDQLHHARAIRTIGAFLTRLVDLSPGTIRWVLVLREHIDLPVPRWLAEGLIDIPIGEDVLHFRAEDVERAAQMLGCKLPAAFLHEVHVQTAGWPAGVMFALRARGDKGRSEGFIFTAQSYTMLAEAIFDDRTEREREFLLATCMLPDLDETLGRACGFGDCAELLKAMEPDSGFIFARNPLQYHDSFAAYLRDRLQALGKVHLYAVLTIACSALVEVGRTGDALRLVTKHRVRSEMVRLLHRYGLEMVQTADEDILKAAIAVLGAPDETWSAQLLAVKSIFESRAARFDTSDAYLALAMERAQEPATRAYIAYRCASEMLLRRRTEALPLLERFANDTQIPLRLCVSIGSALGTAYMQAGENAKADSSISAAMKLAGQLDDDVLLVPLFVRVAYVAFYSGAHDRANALASSGAALAEKTSQFSMAFSACSTLYAIAADRDDVAECLAHLRRLSENAAKAGNPLMQQYGLMAMYELEMERGNLAAVHDLENALAIFDVHYEAQDSADTVLPSRALELAAQGRFTSAHRLLVPSAASETEADRAALRWSEIALYAAAARDAAEAKAALREVRKALRNNAHETVRSYRAKLFCALALRLLSRGIARRLLHALKDAAPSQRSRAMFDAVQALYADDVASAAKTLRRHDLGGFANVFQAMPAFARGTATTLRAAPARREMVDEIDAVLNGLIARLDHIDPLTAEHSRAVASWCSRLARKLDMPAEDVVLATRSGLVHDVGKLHTPKHILDAPRSLSAAEWDIMRAHALAGEGIVLEMPVIAHLGPAARSHHERLDGKGYPDGLSGLRIPPVTRIVTVADCFNAMIGRRPYRKPMPPEVALAELDRHRGTQFDPEIVDALIEVVTGSSEQRYTQRLMTE